MKFRVSVLETIESFQVFEIDADSPTEAAKIAKGMIQPLRSGDELIYRDFTVMEPEIRPIFGDELKGYRVLASYSDSLDELDW